MAETFVKTGGFSDAARTLRLLTLTPAEKRLWIARRARMVIAQARQNVRDQKTPEGTAFIPRKDGSGRPMLRHLTKSSWMGFRFTSDDSGEVFFPGKMIKDHSSAKANRVSQGYIASKHQHGSDEKFKRAKQSKLFSREERSPACRGYWKKYCNEEQARELVRCGYGNPVAWIMTHVTAGHAWGWLSNTKESWSIRVAARPFLGIDAETSQRWGDELLTGIRGKFRAKDYSNLIN